MAVDSTFEFEKRRNRPVKYDRDLMGKTIVAMQRVQEIKSKREERFHGNRMRDAKKEKKQQARVEIEKSVDLLAPAVAKREEVMRNVVDSARARIAARKKAKEPRITNKSTAVDMESWRRNPQMEMSESIDWSENANLLLSSQIMCQVRISREINWWTDDFADLLTKANSLKK